MIKDLPEVEVILRARVKDSETGEVLEEEIAEILGSMKASIEHDTDKTFFTACENSRVVGVVGMKDPDPEMATDFSITDNAIEIINLFVLPDQAKRGIGKALVDKVEWEAALVGGYSEIIVNSGPRYKETAWGFYDQLPGFSRVGILKDQYGPGRDAPVWRKVLKNA